MTTYSTLNVAKPTYDPVHQNVKTRTVKFDACDSQGRAIRSITREQGVVTVACLKSGRAVEVPWSGCVFGVMGPTVAEGDEAETPTDPLYPPQRTERKPRRPRGEQ